MNQNEQKPGSVRVGLVQTVLEYYIDAVLFEMLDIDVLEPQLQSMLDGLLAFETKVILNRDVDIISKNTLDGRITFLDGEGQGAGLKTVMFQVSASAQDQSQG